MHAKKKNARRGRTQFAQGLQRSGVLVWACSMSASGACRTPSPGIRSTPHGINAHIFRMGRFLVHLCGRTVAAETRHKPLSPPKGRLLVSSPKGQLLPMVQVFLGGSPSREISIILIATQRRPGAVGFHIRERYFLCTELPPPLAAADLAFQEGVIRCCDVATCCEVSTQRTVSGGARRSAFQRIISQLEKFLPTPDCGSAAPRCPKTQRRGVRILEAALGLFAKGITLGGSSQARGPLLSKIDNQSGQTPPDGRPSLICPGRSKRHRREVPLVGAYGRMPPNPLPLPPNPTHRRFSRCTTTQPSPAERSARTLSSDADAIQYAN